jgi:uncharacterized membrane protein
MTDKSIKLLPLAVICGCSLIGLALVPIVADIRPFLMLAVFVVSGIWFIIYWILSGERP